jgi:DNA-binding MarR family transcriptional regulator
MADRPSAEHVAAWRALLTAHAELTDQIDASLRAAGVIPLRWYDALLALYEAPDRRLRLADMAKAALLSRSGLTRLVDRLDGAGLLVRQPAENDGRGAFAVLTPAGLQAMRRCWRVYGAEIEARVGRRLTVAEARTLRGLLARLVEAA